MPFAPDPRKVRHVRLLLAKADRTNFPEEADACRRKAGELMAKYGISERQAREGYDRSVGEVLASRRRYEQTVTVVTEGTSVTFTVRSFTLS